MGSSNNKEGMWGTCNYREYVTLSRMVPQLLQLLKFRHLSLYTVSVLNSFLRPIGTLDGALTLQLASTINNFMFIFDLFKESDRAAQPHLHC